MRKLTFAFSLLGSLVVFALPSGEAAARITHLDVVSKAPLGTFKSGDYVIWEARFVGELSPASESIPDLEKAPRNARGTVDYATRVTLIMPAEPMRGNGAILVDLPNRGVPTSHIIYNIPHNLPQVFPKSVFFQGTGFLE